MLAAAFHLEPRASFCFRDVSAGSYRPGSWNLILSSRFRERGTRDRRGRRNVVAVKRAKNTNEDSSRRKIERESVAPGSLELSLHTLVVF